MSSELLLSVGFIIVILSVLFFDLLVVGRNSHVVKPREALIWTSVWVSLALLFYFILANFGHLLHSIDTREKLLEVTKLYNPDLRFESSGFQDMLREYRMNMGINYVTGFIIEQTLSIDNVFVILILLQGFGVALENYKRVLCFDSFLSSPDQPLCRNLTGFSLFSGHFLSIKVSVCWLPKIMA
jgi:tellurite resistance protein TerC